MNVVLDTNVLVSGLMTQGGACAIILDLLVDGRFTAVFDGRIMDEYRRVCAKPQLHLDANAVHDFIRFMNDVAERVTATPLRADIPDPDDLPFLEVAVEAHAILVTGNRKHFPQEPVTAVRVLTPREFLEILRLPLG